jgi:hypothetical protein
MAQHSHGLARSLGCIPDRDLCNERAKNEKFSVKKILDLKKF